MDKFLHKSLLYDYYGGFLTPKQRDAYIMYHHNDMTLSEIAESTGTTKQAVSYMLQRVDKSFAKYEAHLKLIENRSIIKEKLDLTASLAVGSNAVRIKEILSEILDIV